MIGNGYQIGRSALAAYQAAISVTGQNIANVANPNYTRQTGRLTAQLGGEQVGDRPGGGVALSQIQRQTDAALVSRLRTAGATRDGAQVIAGALSQTEALYNELSEDDLSTQLSQLFASFAALQTSPQDITQRDLVIANADRVIQTVNRQREGLVNQVGDLNEQAVIAAEEVNGAAQEIAELNSLIVQQEAGGYTASALRDRRDALLNDLGSMVDLLVREQPNGSINVYVGSEPLVAFDRARELTIDRRLEDGLEIASIRFADSGAPVSEGNGQLPALVAARDLYVRDQLDRLDELSRGLIFEINSLHSEAVGLHGMASVYSEYHVTDPGATLNDPAAGLTFVPQNGTLLVKLRDTEAGTETTSQIEVDLDGLNGDDTTLNSLAADLNAIDGLSASVTADNRLFIQADAGLEFHFAEDRSNVLAALGIGGFFTGTSADSLDVVADVRSDVGLIAASLSGSLADADNAGRIARLTDGNQASSMLGGRSIRDFHLGMVGDLAVQASAAQTDAEAADAVYTGLYAQREAISGVSLDEEAINLSQYQTAFEGAARYLSVVDEMTNEILALT